MDEEEHQRHALATKAFLGALRDEGERGNKAHEWVPARRDPDATLEGIQRAHQEPAYAASFLKKALPGLRSGVGRWLA